VRAAVAGGSLAGVRDDRRQRLERALDEIERAVARRDGQVADLSVERFLDPLRREPQFRRVMQQPAFP
jgi:hypothetical protein